MFLIYFLFSIIYHYENYVKFFSLQQTYLSTQEERYFDNLMRYFQIVHNLADRDVQFWW